MKDSRSATKPELSKVEKVRAEMERVVVSNRYGGGTEDRAALLTYIRQWRSDLAETE